MTFYTTTARDASRVDPTLDPDQCRRADFARQAVIAAFGRHARALDQADFIDRLPVVCRSLRQRALTF